MLIPLRFPTTLLLSLICFTAPAWGDFQAGIEAFNRKDYATALREWRPLAKQGEAEAQYALGVLHEYGYGVPQDYGQARQWYEKAAAQGHRNAQHNLGVLYANGRGTRQDHVLAYKWFDIAASFGDNAAAMLRDGLIEQMTPTQIAEAQRLAREWKSTPP